VAAECGSILGSSQLKRTLVAEKKLLVSWPQKTYMKKNPTFLFNPHKVRNWKKQKFIRHLILTFAKLAISLEMF